MLRFRKFTFIIQDMKKIVNMWRMTTYLETLTNERLKDISVIDDTNESGIRVLKLQRTALIRDYAKALNYSQIYAYGILEDCVKEGYIYEDRPTDEGAKGRVLRVTRGKNGGTDLIDKIWFFPIGLAEAIWLKHGRFLAGMVVGTFGALILAFAKEVSIRIVTGHW